MSDKTGPHTNKISNEIRYSLKGTALPTAHILDRSDVFVRATHTHFTVHVAKQTPLLELSQIYHTLKPHIPDLEATEEMPRMFRLSRLSLDPQMSKILWTLYTSKENSGAVTLS